MTLPSVSSVPELTASQRESLHEALVQLDTELTALLDATADGEKPVKLKDNQGRLSRMDELHTQSILKANRTLTTNRLKAVRRAKARFEAGSYGYCLGCDEPIAYSRLDAYPDAERCLGCQSDVERL